ncbi:MAG: hypothetical protein JWL97_4533 [Gemmatimonadales bacterium]|nr:hypothetical protein [Gemmatimonadales bacterium]
MLVHRLGTPARLTPPATQGVYGRTGSETASCQPGGTALTTPQNKRRRLVRHLSCQLRYQATRRRRGRRTVFESGSAPHTPSTTVKHTMRLDMSVPALGCAATGDTPVRCYVLSANGPAAAMTDISVTFRAAAVAVTA